MIQSLLTQSEYDELSKFYNTYYPAKRKSEKSEGVIIDGQEIKPGPPPNYIMGDGLTAKEIKWINKRLDEKLLLVKVRYNEKGEMWINETKQKDRERVNEARENLDLNNF